MEQPRVYNTEDELIKWLKYDLKEQRREIADREEIFSGKKIPLKKVEEKYLTLNIGIKIENISNNYIKYIKINFEFNLNDIIYKLFDKLSYEDIGCYINCNGLIFNSEANFSNTSFKNKVFFMGSQFIRNANFSWTLFNNEINFTGSKFIGGTDFYYTSFNNKANFNFASFNNEVDFSDTLFKNIVDFCYSSFDNEVNFSRVSFGHKVDFSEALFRNNINFSYTSFNNEVDFSYASFDKKADFFNALFKNNVDFSHTLFKNNVNFSRVSFMNEAKFSYTLLNEVDFYQASFNNVFFTNIIFYKYITFIRITIVKKINILNIYNNITDNEIIFDSIIFENTKSNLYIQNINNYILHKISINNLSIDGKIILRNIKADNIDLKNTNTLGNLHVIDCEFNEEANSETARILKNDEYKKSNTIKALEYEAKEISKHKEYLVSIKNKNYKEWGDIISIELSSLYSDNGLNWIKSFLCTILLPTFFFIASYIDYNISICMHALFIFYVINRLKLKDIAKYISNTILLYLFTFWLLPTIYLYLNRGFINELLNFFIPIDFEQIKNGKFIYYYKNDIIEIILRGLSYYLGKIAFWYGSVQTVQSFRKFSKKE